MDDDDYDSSDGPMLMMIMMLSFLLLLLFIFLFTPLHCNSAQDSEVSSSKKHIESLTFKLQGEINRRSEVETDLEDTRTK